MAHMTNDQLAEKMRVVIALWGLDKTEGGCYDLHVHTVNRRGKPLPDGVLLLEGDEHEMTPALVDARASLSNLNRAWPNGDYEHDQILFYTKLVLH